MPKASPVLTVNTSDHGRVSNKRPDHGQPYHNSSPAKLIFGVEKNAPSPGRGVLLRPNEKTHHNQEIDLPRIPDHSPTCLQPPLLTLQTHPQPQFKTQSVTPSPALQNSAAGQHHPIDTTQQEEPQKTDYCSGSDSTVPSESLANSPILRPKQASVIFEHTLIQNNKFKKVAQTFDIFIENCKKIEHLLRRFSITNRSKTRYFFAIGALALMVFLGLAQAGNVYGSIFDIVRHLHFVGTSATVVVIGVSVFVCLGWFFMYINGIFKLIQNNSIKNKHADRIHNAFLLALERVKPMVEIVCAQSSSSKDAESLLHMFESGTNTSTLTPNTPKKCGHVARIQSMPNLSALSSANSDSDAYASDDFKTITIDLMAQFMIDHLKSLSPKTNNQELLKQISTHLTMGLPVDGDKYSTGINQIMIDINLRLQSEPKQAQRHTLYQKVSTTELDQIELVFDDLTEVIGLKLAHIRDNKRHKFASAWQDFQQVFPDETNTKKLFAEFRRDLYDRFVACCSDQGSQADEKVFVSIKKLNDNQRQVVGAFLAQLEQLKDLRFSAVDDQVRTWAKTEINKKIESEKGCHAELRMQKKWWRLLLPKFIAWVNVIANGVVILGSALLGISSIIPVSHQLSPINVILALCFFTAGALATAFTTRHCVIRGYKRLWSAIAYKKTNMIGVLSCIVAGITTIGSCYIAFYSANHLLPNLSSFIGVSWHVPAAVNLSIAVVVAILTLFCAFALYGCFTYDFLNHVVNKKEGKSESGGQPKNYLANIAFYFVPVVATAGQLFVVYHSIAHGATLGSAGLAATIILICFLAITLGCSFCNQFKNSWLTIKSFFGCDGTEPLIFKNIKPICSGVMSNAMEGMPKALQLGRAATGRNDSLGHTLT